MVNLGNLLHNIGYAIKNYERLLWWLKANKIGSLLKE